MLGQEKQGSNHSIRLLHNICIRSYKVSSKHLHSCEIWGSWAQLLSTVVRMQWCQSVCPRMEKLGANEQIEVITMLKEKLWHVFCWFLFEGCGVLLWGFVFVGPAAFSTIRYCPHSDLPCAVANLCKACWIFIFFFLCKLSAADWKTVGLNPTWHTPESNLSRFMLRYIYF